MEKASVLSDFSREEGGGVGDWVGGFSFEFKGRRVDGKQTRN